MEERGEFVSIPYGKGKDEFLEDKEDAEMLYQFPMGKVKIVIRYIYRIGLEVSIPYGKGKGIVQAMPVRLSRIWYQFPMGKVKS